MTSRLHLQSPLKLFARIYPAAAAAVTCPSARCYRHRSSDRCTQNGDDEYAKDTYLTASMMAEIVPVDLELGVVVHMHKLVYDRLLHMALAHELPLAKQDSACLRAESTRASSVAWRADEVV